MSPQLRIGDIVLNENSDCFVIAEVGHNHQGSLEKAKQMFAAAKECGCDAVKLQKRHNRTLYTADLYNKPYENENSFGATYGEHREALEFGLAEYQELMAYARELGLIMFATAFDFISADFLAGLDIPVYKIASGDLTNTPLLKYVAGFGKPMIISTGGATMDDVRRAYDAVMPINSQICLLQCTAAYPATHEELNLRVIETYRKEFPQALVGLSDHENGIAMALAAYVLGARVVEKHFTLNHTWKGTDQAFSLEPIGMRKLVRDLRRARTALGDGMKSQYPGEKSPIMKMGKKIVAARPLVPGCVLTMDDIALKSPGDGLPPYELENVLGKKLITALKPDDNITFEMLEGTAQPGAEIIRAVDQVTAQANRIAAQVIPAGALRSAPPMQIEFYGPAAAKARARELAGLLAGIRLVAFDFDGVFTDNTVYTMQDGTEAVSCWRGDGIGLRKLDRLGIAKMVISSEPNCVVAARCQKMGIECRHSVENKLELLEQLAREMQIGLEQIAFVGNDINDLPCLKAVGLPIAVHDSHPHVVADARYVTTADGGQGAVREVCDLLEWAHGWMEASPLAGAGTAQSDSAVM